MSEETGETVEQLIERGIYPYSDLYIPIISEAQLHDETYTDVSEICVRRNIGTLDVDDITYLTYRGHRYVSFGVCITDTRRLRRYGDDIRCFGLIESNVTTPSPPPPIIALQSWRVLNDDTSSPQFVQIPQRLIIGGVDILPILDRTVFWPRIIDPVATLRASYPSFLDPAAPVVDAASAE